MDKKKIFSDLLIKLCAACFLSFSVILFFFIQDSFDFYKLSALLSALLYNPWFYALFCYAILCSFIIDKLALKQTNITKKALLYIIFGYLFFLPFPLFSSDPFIIYFIAGSIGAICALFFYLCTYIAQKAKWFRYSIPILIPILFITIAAIDFTKKEQWVEHTTENEFEATFSYFNGKHKIPIYAKEGAIIEMNVQFLVGGNNSYGHGLHFASEFNKNVPVSEINTDTYQLAATKTGTYYIVVTGENLTGKIKAKWNIH
ncbi:hypothetical protein COE15_14220 [Bacillus cereus]|uniref:hypothetical protein n=1 Tax=unclassified Bacillus (in: firmicutes) TaxID=185979 RepID=UPI00047B97DE|nr:MULTISPECIES: hypothetical protein [unclassified Bacillus (in: firmicutes)]PFE04741.1 hypothetical protein CN288_06765 [Bacillus sp. AFS023182]PGY00218.1 hypothetical protein COE15_14220 [Bacillus cereus]